MSASENTPPAGVTAGEVSGATGGAGRRDDDDQEDEEDDEELDMGDLNANSTKQGTIILFIFNISAATTRL